MPTQSIVKRPVIIPIGPSIAYIPLTQGQFALIDSDDVYKVCNHNWCAEWGKTLKAYYAKRGTPQNRALYLHHVIASWDGFLTDHRPGNSLDNRKSNLRPATKSQNAMNSRMTTLNKSGARGVSWRKDIEKWRAVIIVGRKQRFLGHYETIEEASVAYRKAASTLHGEFTRAPVNQI